MEIVESIPAVITVGEAHNTFVTLLSMKTELLHVTKLKEMSKA